MSFDYTKSAATAARLLDKFGQSLTFSLPDRTEGGAPGVPGTTIPGRSITGRGVMLDYDNSEIDGTTIQTGDARVLIEATDEPPANGMTAAINGKTWRVEDWRELAPAAIVVMYTLQVRRV